MLAKYTRDHTSYDEMQGRGWKSIAFDLAREFPVEELLIQNRTNKFLEYLHAAIDDAQIALEKSGIKIDQALVKPIEEFYHLKTEAHLEGDIKQAFREKTAKFLRTLLKVYSLPRDNALSSKFIPESIPSSVRFSQTSDNNRTLVAKISPEITFTKNDIENLLARLSEIDAHLEKVFDIAMPLVKACPSLYQELKMRVLTVVDAKERFIKRKIYETIFLFGYALKEYQKGNAILDVCSGTATLTTMLRVAGYPAFGFDVKQNDVRSGRRYSFLLGGSYDSTHYNTYMGVADALTDQLPSCPLWIAKHPCGQGIALPDEIIKKFALDKKASSLCLLTCCGGKAKDACPHEYEDAGLVTKKDWHDLSDASSKLGHNPEGDEIATAQSALLKINNIRVTYMRQRMGIEAKIVQVPHSIMNQMIIAKKYL